MVIDSLINIIILLPRLSQNNHISFIEHNPSGFKTEVQMCDKLEKSEAGKPTAFKSN